MPSLEKLRITKIYLTYDEPTQQIASKFGLVYYILYAAGLAVGFNGHFMHTADKSAIRNMTTDTSILSVICGIRYKRVRYCEGALYFEIENYNSKSQHQSVS